MSAPPRAAVPNSAASILIGLFVLVTVIGSPALPSSTASAKVAGLRITELSCSANPEVVAITNQGTAAQDLTGWSLKSDPPATEMFDLGVVGTLAPGASVFVQSGPGAGGSFIWSTAQIFRDGDASDYARIADNTGATVHELSCGTASAAPTTAETTAPTTAGGSALPNGGGPPLADEEWELSTSAGMAAVGALLLLLAAASFAAVAWPRCR